MKQKLSDISCTLAADATEMADGKVKVDFPDYAAPLIISAETSIHIAFKDEYDEAVVEVQIDLENAEGFAPWNKDIDKTASLGDVQKMWADAQNSVSAVRKALAATQEARASLLDKFPTPALVLEHNFVDPSLWQYTRIVTCSFRLV